MIREFCENHFRIWGVWQERKIFNYVAVIDIRFVWLYLNYISRQQNIFGAVSVDGTANLYGLRWIIKLMKSLVPWKRNLIFKWNIFPQNVTTWKLINYFIASHPSPGQISLKSASIKVTLRNWSPFEYHISGRLISLPIAFNENHRGECVGAKCKKLTIDWINFICLHSRNILVFASIECKRKKNSVEYWRFNRTRKQKRIKQVFSASLRWWNSEEISF